MDTLKKINYRVRAGIEKAQVEYQRRVSNRVELKGLVGLGGEKIYITDYDVLLESITELMDVYEKVPESKRISLMVLLDAHASATIEGAHTTVEKVRKCLENPVSKDDKMVSNTYKGCMYAYDNCIDANNIRTLWEIIVKEVCENQDKAGELYRDGMVYVGSATEIIHTPAQAKDIEKYMNNMFSFLENSDIDEIIKSFVAHFYFVYIHPFCDGNGRMARTLNSSYLYHNGYEKVKSIPIASAINDKLQGYYGAITDVEEVIEDLDGHKWFDISPFISYMIDSFQQGALRALLAEKELNGNEKRLLSRMNKIGVGAEITVKKAMKITKLSESSTRNILKSLANKGYLRINDEKKEYIYILVSSMK